MLQVCILQVYNIEHLGKVWVQSYSCVMSFVSSIQVFAGLYPMETGEYPAMRVAVEKLTLNDSSVSVHRDSSVALGQGWRLGFLGLLHMDVFRQRLEEVHVHYSVLL